MLSVWNLRVPVFGQIWEDFSHYFFECVFSWPSHSAPAGSGHMDVRCFAVVPSVSVPEARRVLFPVYRLSAVRMRSFLSRCTPVRRFPLSLLRSAGRGSPGPFISVCFLVRGLPPVSFSQFLFLCPACLFSHSAKARSSLLTEASLSWFL